VEQELVLLLMEEVLQEIIQFFQQLQVQAVEVEEDVV
jgi:hypothetical protein